MLLILINIYDVSTKPNNKKYIGRYIPWMHLTAAGALHLTANIVAYFGPICTYDIFLTLGLLFAVVLSAGESLGILLLDNNYILIYQLTLIFLLITIIWTPVIDVTFYKITFFGMKLAGVLLLMIGFLVCLLPENWNECLYELVNERFIRWKKQRSLKKNRNKVQDMSTGQMSRLRTPSGRVKWFLLVVVEIILKSILIELPTKLTQHFVLWCGIELERNYYYSNIPVWQTRHQLNLAIINLVIYIQVLSIQVLSKCFFCLLWCLCFSRRVSHIK